MTKTVFRELKENLTPRQRAAWQMRYQYRWKMERIAIELGIKQHTVTELLQRAQRRVGLSEPIRVKVIRTKPRFVRTQSLSIVFDI